MRKDFRRQTSNVTNDQSMTPRSSTRLSMSVNSRNRHYRRSCPESYDERRLALVGAPRVSFHISLMRRCARFPFLSRAISASPSQPANRRRSDARAGATSSSLGPSSTNAPRTSNVPVFRSAFKSTRPTRLPSRRNGKT